MKDDNRIENLEIVTLARPNGVCADDATQKCPKCADRVEFEEIIEGENRKFITPKKGKQPKRVEPGYLFPNRQQLPVREAEV